MVPLESFKVNPSEMLTALSPLQLVTLAIYKLACQFELVMGTQIPWTSGELDKQNFETTLCRQI